MSGEQADVVVRGGTLVTEGWVGPAAVVVRDDRITAIVGEDDAAGVQANRVVDATGCVVLPGGVDPHCHVALPLGAYTTKDSFWSASLAALAGGTTTIVDFAIPGVGQHPVEIFDHRAKLAETSRCDFSFHGCINSPDADVREIVHTLADRGTRTIKLFTTYRDLLMVDPETVRAVMLALREVSGLTYVHAEANDLVEQAQERASAAGMIGASGHATTRPVSAEEEAVAGVLNVARQVEAPVYFVHQSTPGAVDLVTAARREGVRAYSETCPHYLTLDEGRYATDTPERWVCCPPLRSRTTVEGLGLRLSMGFLHTVGSDHCCYDSIQKAEHADDVREMPNGLPGVETRMPVMFSSFVATGRMTLQSFAALTAANPARLNGLYPRKGTISVGSDADLVILDPRETRIVGADVLHMETDYSPYDGMTLTGWPRTVLARGRVVLDDGQLLDPGPVGEFLPASPITT